MLRLVDISVERRTHLFQVSELELKPGDFVALIGANGSGKSTFLKYLTGELSLKGQVSWNGELLTPENKPKRARIFAKVDNSFAGLDYMSTFEYLALGRIPYTGALGLLAESDRAIIAHYAAAFHLTEFLQLPTDQLSDGERQRAGIARALIQEAPVILLDEPTSFLDYPGKIDVMKRLQEVARTSNKVIVMATHDLDLATDFCSGWLVVSTKDRVLNHLSTISDKRTLIQLAFPELD